MAARHIRNKHTLYTDFQFDATEAANEFIKDETADYSHFKTKMSQAASFKRDYEGCVTLLGEIKEALENYPERHRSIMDYYLDRDMLISMKALLEAIISENPETGSRGGAIFIKNGEIVKENTYYRDYLSVTKKEEIDFVKVSPVPCKQKPFEHYLSKINEGEIL